MDIACLSPRVHGLEWPVGWLSGLLTHEIDSIFARFGDGFVVVSTYLRALRAGKH